MTKMHEGAAVELVRRLAALAHPKASPIIQNIGHVATLADDAYRMLEGEIAPLSVEVSAVLQNNDGCGTVNDQPERANMFSVYIRNPLAFHIMDFPRAFGWPAVQRNEAFTFAEALAAHLGCKVDSTLARFEEVAPAAPDAISMDDMIEAAACLWENVVRLRGSNDEPAGMESAFDAQGTSSIRAIVIGWADKVHHDWTEAQRLHAWDDPFDWEFVPQWMELNVDWYSDQGPELARVRRLPAMGQSPATLHHSLQPLLIEQLGLTYETVGGGAHILSHTFGNGWSVSVSCLDGGGLPRPDSWHIGIYQPGEASAEGDGNAYWELRSDDGKLNLSQAIGAAWAIGADA